MLHFAGQKLKPLTVAHWLSVKEAMISRIKGIKAKAVKRIIAAFESRFHLDDSFIVFSSLEHSVFFAVFPYQGVGYNDKQEADNRLEDTGCG